MDSKANLENLQRSSGLKAEPPDRKECDGLMRSARDRLRDAGNPLLSFASRFDLAYNAAHAIALTALPFRVCIMMQIDRTNVGMGWVCCRRVLHLG